MYRLIMFLFIVSMPCSASDHADSPLYTMGRDDLKLTGLHSFVDQQNLILISGSNPMVQTESGSYQFPTDVHFNFYIDYNAQVTFDNSQNNQRYGGTIVKSSTIQQEFSISLKFAKKNKPTDPNSFEATIVGGKNPQSSFKIEALIRDDPFTFPSFHGHNVAAIVLSLPLSTFDIKAGQPLLIWSTITSSDDKMIQEHVGRALRSQFSGSQELNRYHPSEQEEKTGMPADVIIYDTKKTALLPNGRALADDTLSILCQAGDQEVCQLLQKAKEGDYDPLYNGKNDKDFLTQFPFFAAPHP